MVATGTGKAHVPVFEGMEYVEGYEDMSTNPEDYEGQTVLILGSKPFAAVIHLNLSILKGISVK